MSKGQHTPWPWEVSASDETVVITGYECERSFVASTLSFDSSVADSIDYANARLIAAAPELLEALEEVLTLFDAHDDCKNIETTFDSRLRARAAIAKARGEA